MYFYLHKFIKLHKVLQIKFLFCIAYLRNNNLTKKKKQLLFYYFSLFSIVDDFLILAVAPNKQIQSNAASKQWKIKMHK